jgi:hypothetical protein
MLSPQELYPLVVSWLQASRLVPQATALAALAQLVTALLVGQSLRSSALMRALLSPQPVPARQRYKRVARAWQRPWLTPARLTPGLVRAALALVPPDPAGGRTAGLTHLALDSVRCGPWEVFTLGVVWAGRVLPVGWAVLPYPWPTGRFTPTVCALLRQVAAAWPAGRAAHLVADRAFPSRALFQTLRAVGWGWTVRLQARHWVTVRGQLQQVRAQLAGGPPTGWTCQAAHYGRAGCGLAGSLVRGRGLVVLPVHQRGPASLRRRAQQWARRQQHLASKHPGPAARGALAADAWVVLFSSHADWLAATDSYRRRWAIEGSYRDAQGGWDGQHGWDLEAVLAAVPDAGRVERVVGLWALGALLQTWVGVAVGQPSAPPAVRAVLGQWTTSGRLSVWARGRFALTEPSGRLRAWLCAILQAGAERLAAGPLRPPAAEPPGRRAA